MTKMEFRLDGLGCANCAAKMESQIKNMPSVKNASVDFVSKKLIIESDENYELKKIIDDASGIVKKIEPHVNVIMLNSGEKSKIKEAEDDSREEENKKEIFKIIASSILFFIGLVFDFSKNVEIMLFLMSYIIIGSEILIRAIKNILRGQVFDENFLMTIATIGAFIIGEFPEGVAVMLFYQVGELFQDIAVERSRKSISDLMDIRPDYANLKIGGEIKKVSPEDVKIGDYIVVKPGEKVPLDGVVAEGNSMVDTSSLTGESVPREVEAGSDVLSGFINNNGILTIEVTKEFGDSTVSKILDLVQNASSKKAKTENFITKFARYYTPAVVFTALFLAFLPPIFLKETSFSEWVYRALVFLVISCPCALVISIPLGFFGGIGGSSKRGILVKGSNFLEALNNVEAVVFDKTGTLTKGVFNVTGIHPYNGFSSDELIEFAAYAENFSNHPIANSILKYYQKEIKKSKIENYEEIPGHGIKICLDNTVILAGNNKLMDMENISYEKEESVGTAVYVAVNNMYAGCIVISDELKDDSLKAINELKRAGIKKTVMLTGDLKSVGEKVGSYLNIDEIYAELLPVDKVEKLETVKSSMNNNGKVVFVGDGINDAPVLAMADIGIAMGGLGSDAAIEAADVVIMTDEPSKIAEAIKIAKRTNKIVWQNIIFAIGVKVIVLLLGAMGIANMWEAVFADVGVAFIAILNAMRVMKVSNAS